MLLGRKYPTRMTCNWFQFLESSLGASSHGTPWSFLWQPELPPPAAPCTADSCGSIQVPAPAMAALVAAKEVNSGLGTLWDAGAGQAWSWESVFTGQKLIELFL